jgi:hypothetical protein
VHPSGFGNVPEERFYWAAILYYIAWREDDGKKIETLKEALAKLEGCLTEMDKSYLVRESRREERERRKRIPEMKNRGVV